MSYRNMFIDIHPWLPIPGTAIKRSGGDSVDFPLPTYMGQSFTHLCHLVSIIRQVLGQYYGGGDGSTPKIRTSEKAAEHLHKRLMIWADSLPAAMATIGITPSHVTVVQSVSHLFQVVPCVTVSGLYPQGQEVFSALNSTLFQYQSFNIDLYRVQSLPPRSHL